MPDPVLELLRLLAEDASAEELDEQARKLTADDPDHGPAARELALRVRAELDAHRRRDGELAALVDTARDLASLPTPAGCSTRSCAGPALLGADVAYLTLTSGGGRRTAAGWWWWHPAA